MHRGAAAVLLVLLVSTDVLASPPETLRVASVQMQISDDIGVNLERILRGVEEGKEAGARVVLFPETALSGFFRPTVESLDFSQVRGAMTRIAEAAKAAGIYVLYGCATENAGGRPRNSALVVGPDGNEVARYHKMFPESWFAAGDRLALFEVDGILCTLMICHDERFPELLRIPVLAGAQVCFYISYEVNAPEAARRKAEGYRAQLIARAAENGVWVAQSNGVGPLPEGERVSLGQSRLVAPDGTVVTEAPALEESLLVVDIQPEKARRGNALESLGNPLVAAWWRAGMELLDIPPRGETAVPLRDTVRLGLMQGMPKKWDLEANMDTFLQVLKTASEHGVELFVTPECWLDGYAAPDRASTPEKLRAVSQDPETSPLLRRVAEEAAARGMHICFGFSSIEDGKIYNAAGLWDDSGKLVGIYHKTHLQTHDLQYSPGMDLPVWPTPWGPVGIMICADRRWPETARTLRLKGARLILNPTYGMRHEANEWWMRTRGYENQCYVAFAHPGVGFVVNPKGELSGKRDSEEPGVLVCEVDLSKAKDDNHLRDRRPDLYGVLVSPVLRD